jgi:putative cardiolipin synthase
MKKYAVSIILISTVAVAAFTSARYMLSESDITRFASVANLETTSASEVITDNVKAFDKRIEMIQKAKKSLELAYYIYSDDESSSYLSNELIKAANRGVKVRVLLDYITNYGKLDTFVAMQKRVDTKNNGSIEFRFFGRPTPNIIKDAIYMTTPCSEANRAPGKEVACTAEKKPIADKMQVAKGMNAYNYNSGFSGVFLSGFYAKSPAASNFALVVGGKFDPSSVGQGEDGKPMTEDEKRGLVDLVKLYKEAKFGSVLSAIKLQAAMLFYGDEVRGIIAFMDKMFPTGQESYDLSEGKEDFRGKDWDHITDFLHHKLLLVDNQELLIGGRNIENSYHMESNPSGKYVFMDTDIHLNLKESSGVKVQSTFKDLWDFQVMVAKVSDIYLHAPNDTQVELDKCMKTSKLPTSCPVLVGALLSSQPGIDASRNKRHADAIAQLNKKSQAFIEGRNPSNGNPSFEVDATAKISYIENLPFTKENKTKRIYGSEINKEEKSGKNIHKLWMKAMLNTCKAKTPQTVYLHQAYYLPPTNLLQVLAAMTKTMRESSSNFNEDYKDLNCSKVTIKIVTNSVETTDLSVINIFTRHQMHSLLKGIESSRDKKKAAKLEYYEYKKPSSAVTKSLHTKLSLMGDTAIIGSANADVRSYMMDTNNGVLIQNAPNFVASYGQYMESLLSDSSKVTRMDTEWRNYKKYEANNYQALEAETKFLVDEMARVARESKKKWPTESRIASMKITLLGTMGDVRAKTEASNEMITIIDDGTAKEIKQKSTSNPALKRFESALERTTLELNDFDVMYKAL